MCTSLAAILDVIKFYRSYKVTQCYMREIGGRMDTGLGLKNSDSKKSLKHQLELIGTWHFSGRCSGFSRYVSKTIKEDGS